MNEILSCAINKGFRVSSEDRVKTATSSKGNQIKWRRSDGIWAKADDMGYEGLAEQVASRILAYSNFDEYAEYVSCRIYEDEISYAGCVSADFLADGESLITVQRLYRIHGRDAYLEFDGMDATSRLRLVVDDVTQWTGFAGFGTWMGKLLELDAFILNEDRHLHNIAVVKKPDGTYKPMPVFDNGAALLSDTTRDYPLDSAMSLSRLISRVKSKPLVTDFDKQLAAVADVVGLSLKLNCTPDAMAADVVSQEYSGQIISRVQSVISYQARRYPHLFAAAGKSISPNPLTRD